MDQIFSSSDYMLLQFHKNFFSCNIAGGIYLGIIYKSDLI